MAEQGRPARATRLPQWLSSSVLTSDVVGRSRQGRQQPASSRKRSTADSLASHAISLSESDMDDDDESYYQQDGASDTTDDEQPVSQATAKPGRKAVRVARSKSGPAAVAKGPGIAR
jgi:hypothetical protein